MDAQNYNWYGKVIQALNATFFCALSTIGDDGPWVNPVYFAYDKQLRLYAISQLSSKHMQNILKDPKVAVAIFSTDQKPGGDVLGLQLSGTARLLRDDEVAAACEVYYNRGGVPAAPSGQSDPTQHMGDAAVWKFFQIVPDEVYVFDSETFGEQRQAVPLAKVVEP